MNSLASWKRTESTHSVFHEVSSINHGSSRVTAFHSTAQCKAHLDAFKHSPQLMVMDFTATWCGPCRSMDSVIDELATKFTDVVFVKIDVDKLMEIAQVYEVQTMPTFLLIKQGKVVDAVVGAKKDELHRKIEQHTIQLAY